jgi:hypothetical protein
MAQKLYNVKIFYIDQNKHFSVWHNCNENGIYKLKHFGIKRGIAYFQAYKPQTKNVAPLFTIYIEDVFAISVFYNDGRQPHKEYNIINVQWAINKAKHNKAAGINIYNLKEKKFVETIRF